MKKLDIEKLRKSLELSRKLRIMGLKKREYNLSSPYDRKRRVQVVGKYEA